VRFDDIDVTGLRGAPLNRYRRHTVGIVCQAFNLVPSLTARENIQVPCPPRECRAGLHASAPGPC
jgi:putative ABC transport system ATP-binding protein